MTTQTLRARLGGRARRRTQDLVASLNEGRCRDLTLLMTLLLLLLYAERSWYVRLPATVLAVLGSLSPPARAHRWFWLVTATVVSTGVYLNRLQVDNHKYLLAYWTIALLCACEAVKPAEMLRRSARRLIGLAFFFATLSKLLAPDYLDSSFFHHALLEDERFYRIAALAGRLPEEAFGFNQAAFAALGSHDSLLQRIVLSDTEKLGRLATGLTVWTIGIEALVALAFLWPRGGLAARYRDVLLLAFIVTTYAVAPVMGFGWVLIIMGFASCEADRPLTRAAYLGAFVLLQVYRLPWGDLAGLPG